MNRHSNRKPGRPRNVTPQYRVDATGRAFTKVNGKFITLGRDGDPQARIKFATVIQQVISGELPSHDSDSSIQTVSVNELCLRFLIDYCPRYRTSNNSESAEVRCFRSVIKILRAMYGETPADEFGPLRLRSVREAMVEKGWSRKFINKQIGRVRLIFRLGVSWEMVRGIVVTELKTVPALIEGETSAPERLARHAVPHEDLDAVRKRLRQRNRDLFDLLLLTGARPGELLGLTTAMIEKNGEIWRCELNEHKTRRHGKRRVLFFNPSAQQILRRYLQADQESRLFPIRGDTFSAAIKSACIRAGVPPFTPHALRHTTATRLVDEIGLEAARHLLGHSQVAMTTHYARIADKQAIEAAKRLG